MVGQTLEGKAMLISGINRSGDDISSDISVDGQANTTTPAVQFFLLIVYTLVRLLVKVLKQRTHVFFGQGALFILLVSC